MASFFLHAVSFAFFHFIFNWSQSVSAADNNNGVIFLSPTPGLTVNYQDTVNVTYESPFPSPKLYTFCRNATDGSKLITGIFFPVHFFPSHQQKLIRCAQ